MCDVARGEPWQMLGECAAELREPPGSPVRMVVDRRVGVGICVAEVGRDIDNARSSARLLSRSEQPVDEGGRDAVRRR